MGIIYLDNSATTRLCRAASDAMRHAEEETWGNPGSVHSLGVEASRLLSASRETVLSTFGQRRTGDRLIFCSGGTEADHLALFGTAYAKPRLRGGRIITTDSEHPAILRSAEALAKDGFDVVYLHTKNGTIDLDELESLLSDRTILVSIMTVNNETGAAYPLKEAFTLVKARCPDAVTHTDAVQGYLKREEPLLRTGADLISVSSHKIHGPKGIGALFVSAPVIKAKQLVTALPGGGQEEGYRSGTENVPGIAGFAAAAQEGAAQLSERIAHMRMLRQRLIDEVGSVPALCEIRPNLPAGDAAPHILSLTIPGIRSEVLLRYLSGEGICVSAGSACSAKNPGPSPTLLAFGLSKEAADSTIRVSLSHETTEDEIGRFLAVLAEGVGRLARKTGHHNS